MFTFIRIVVSTLFLCLFSLHANTLESKQTQYTILILKNWQPYYSVDKNGKPTGFAVELFEEVAKNLNLNYRYKTEDTWDDLFLSLENEKAYIVPDIGISKKREALFSYSDFTNTFEIKLFKRKNSNINSIGDLKNKRVGVVQRNIGQRIMQNYTDIQSVVYKTPDEAIRELVSGNIDAICYPALSLSHQLKTMQLDNQIHSFGNLIHEVKRGIGISKKHQDLLPLINQELKSIKQSGKYDELYQKWFIQKSNNESFFTTEEQTFLNNNPILKVQGISTFPPFNFYENGETMGYTVDYLNLMKKYMNVEFEFINNKSFPETISMFKNGEIDILPHIARNKNREEFIEYTDFFHIKYPLGITVHNDLTIAKFSQLKDKIIAVIDKHFITTYIQKHYPNQKMLIVKSTNDGVLSVANEKADVFIGSIPTMNFYINKNWLTNVKTKQIEGLGLPAEVALPMGVQKGNMVLKSILEKVNSKIDYSAQLKLKDKWLNISSSNTNLTKLTIKEKKYLDTKENIKICVLPNWLPFEQIDEQGKHKGIGNDILNRISERIDKKFILVPTKEWSQSLQNIRDRKCDILPVAMDVPSRRDAMNFTKPYVAEPFVVATTADKLFIRDEEDLSNKKVGIVKSYAYIEVLKQKNPLIEIVEVKNTKEGLERVNNGELFGYIDTMPTIGYFIQKFGYFNLKIAGKLPYDIALSIASRNDEPILNSIMQKTLNTISQEEIRKIVGRWIEIKVQQEFDYTILLYIVLFFVLIILLGLYRNKQITAQKNEFQQLIENSTDGVFIMDLQGNLIECSNKACNMLGYTKKEILQLNFLDWEYLFTKEQTQRNINRLTYETVKFISKHKRKDGSIYDAETYANKIKIANKERIYASVRDITERKKDEANLKQALYIFENTYDGITITDEKANIINVNKSFERVTGYTLEEIKGLNPRVLKSDIHDKEFYENMWHSIEEKGFWTGEITNKGKNGDLYSEMLTITAVYDENKNLCNYIGIFTDITTQKNQEKLLHQQSRTAAVGEMLGNIAHQWRQPLSVISSAATGMKLQMEIDSLSQEESIETLDAINHQAQYLSKTIEDFRGFFTEDLSKITTFNIMEVTQKVEHLTIDALNSSFVELHQDIDESITIEGNPNLLIQALINIYNNALDVLKEKESQERRLLFIKVKKENTKVCITIRDNGGGIPKQFLNKVFDPYFTTKHQSQGTGIGLYMTHQIITKQLRGTVEVSNITFEYKDKEYSGAEFIIKI